MSTTVVKGGIVRGSDRVLRTESTVVLNDHNARCHHIHGIPEPVIIAINVDRHQADITLQSRLGELLVDSLSRQKRRPSIYRVAPAKLGLVVQETAMRLARIEKYTTPVVGYEQEPSIRFSIVLDPELDKYPFNDGDVSNQV